MLLPMADLEYLSARDDMAISDEKIFVHENAATPAYDLPEGIGGVDHNDAL